MQSQQHPNGVRYTPAAAMTPRTSTVPVAAMKRCRMETISITSSMGLCTTCTARTAMIMAKGPSPSDGNDVTCCGGTSRVDLDSSVAHFPRRRVCQMLRSSKSPAAVVRRGGG